MGGQAPHSGERVFARAAQRGTASDGFGPLPKRKVGDDEQAKSGRASARVPLGVEDDAFSTEAQSGEDEQSPAIELLDGGYVLPSRRVVSPSSCLHGQVHLSGRSRVDDSSDY